VTSDEAGLDTDELAARAGAAPADVERLTGLGLLEQGDGAGHWSESDVHLVKLALACEAAGLPLELIGRSVGQGRLSFAALHSLPWPQDGGLGPTVAEWCAERGLEPGLAEQGWEAFGLGRPEPGRRLTEADTAVMEMLALGPMFGMDADMSLRVARAYGDNLRRLAQAEASFYHAQVEEPLLASGMDERAMREVATQLAAAAAPMVERMLLAVYYRHRESYMIADLVEHIEAVLEADGYRRRPADPPAMCFADLTGYTRLTEEQGDRAAAKAATEMAAVTQEVAGRHGGRMVKWLGDGVMLHFPGPGPAVVAALELVERTPGIGLPPAHVGLHTGPVVAQDGDYYGRTVNLAARIAGQAGPGQVLVTGEVVAGTTVETVAFRPVGPARLKGVADPVPLFEAATAG
jgi:adenylate cyclase